MAGQALFLVAVALAAVSAVVCSTDGKVVEGYKFGSDQQKYVDWGKDACDISDLMSATTPDFATAKKYYEESNPKNGGKRTGYTKNLQTFATYEFTGEKYFNMYSAWFKDSTWMDSFITEAFKSTGDFATLGSAGRAEGISNTATSSILVAATLHELDTVTFQMSQQKYGDKDGAPESFDEAFAIYAGNPTCGPYTLAQKYAPIFGSIKDCATNSSLINDNTVQAFIAGRKAAKAGDSAGVKTAVDEIVRGILSAHIQAVLKYAVELDNAVKTGKDTETMHAEGYVYYRTIAPLVAAASPTAAKTIYDILDLPNTPNATSKYYNPIKAAFESIYKATGIREEDIGTYGTAPTTSCPTKKSSAAGVSPRLAVLGAVVGAVALFL